MNLRSMAELTDKQRKAIANQGAELFQQEWDSFNADFQQAIQKQQEEEAHTI